MDLKVVIMMEPWYAVHERVAVRRASVPDGSLLRSTADLYAHVVDHIIRTYPENGPLRSMALRKLSESLNDIFDHKLLVDAARQRSVPAETTGGYPALGPSRR